MAKAQRIAARTFDARDAERLTGVKLVTQRDWRRRGFLSNATDGRGRAVYSIDDIAMLAFMQEFASRGLGPSAAIAALPYLSELLAWYLSDRPASENPKTGTISSIAVIETKSSGATGINADVRFIHRSVTVGSAFGGAGNMFAIDLLALVHRIFEQLELLGKRK